jgi:flagellar hook-basal body complex protein FliE
MTDPLGLIGSAGQIGGAPRLDRTPAGGIPADPNAPSFKDLLLKNIDEINKLQQDAAQAIEDLSTGKRNDLEGVMLAQGKADMAFRMLQGVRNQVLKAYDDIQQMRV